MGTWGYSWAQNDDAFDLISDAMAPVRKAIQRAISRKTTGRFMWYDRARATCVMLLSLREPFVDLEDLHMCEQALLRMVNDTEYHATYRATVNIRMSLKAELLRVQERIESFNPNVATFSGPDVEPSVLVKK